MAKNIFLFCLLIILTKITFSQNVGKFGSNLGMKTVLGKELRPPYTDVTSYYSFVEPGTKPDEEKDGKKYYYVYVWIPVAAPEIGVRMISPIPSKMKPEANDFKSATYEKSLTDASSYFDTWITLERAVNIVSKNDIDTKIANAKWVQLDYNDDSQELHAQPSGNKYNSVMRVTSQVSDPLKAITVGLYRIGFTSFKAGEVQGGFVAQIGAPVKLPGIIVAGTLAGLSR